MLKYQFCRLGTINTGLWKLFKCDVAITWHIQNIHTVCVSMQQVYMLGGGGGGVSKSFADGCYLGPRKANPSAFLTCTNRTVIVVTCSHCEIVITGSVAAVYER